MEGRDGHAKRPVLLGTLLVVLASQISISMVSVDFKISVAIVLLPIFVFLSPHFPILRVALLSAPGVFLLRVVFQWITTGTPTGSWLAHAPEMLFYLIYGVLLSLYFKKIPFLPFHWKKCIPLVAIDAAANFAELLVRLGRAALVPEILLQLIAVGVGRSLLVLAAIRALDYYGFQVLRREDAERYQRLLMMTASLKSEVAWMDKGTDLIENTMNSAYQLYSQLRTGHTGPSAVNTALTIAKDIHEVKKEYFLIMRGISEALDAEAGQEGMRLSELFPILGKSVDPLLPDVHLPQPAQQRRGGRRDGASRPHLPGAAYPGGGCGLPGLRRLRRNPPRAYGADFCPRLFQQDQLYHRGGQPGAGPVYCQGSDRGRAGGRGGGRLGRRRNYLYHPNP